MNFKTYYTVVGLVVFLFSFPKNLNAQDYNTFGLRVGLNSANIFSIIPDETNVRRDIAISGFYKMHITEELIFFQPELGFSRKGSKMRLDDVDYNLNLNYLDLPLLLSIGKKNISFVEIGGYLSYLVNSNLSNANSLDVNTDDLIRLDYGLAVGLNANYENYSIGLRYYYGLRNIAEGTMENLLGEKSRNSTFQIYFTFTFF